MIFNKNIFKKILFVGPDYLDHRGGIGAVLETYHHFLPSFNFIPTFKPFSSNIKKATFFIGQIVKIYKTLQSRPDLEIVHIHGSHKGSMYRKFATYIIAQKICKRQVVYHIHSSSYDLFYLQSNKLQKKIIASFVNGVDQVICLSPTWFDFFSTHFTPKKLSIINNVVIPPAVITKKTFDKFAVKLLFLGRIGQRKGIFDLLEVLSENKSLFQNRIHVSIGGDGEIERLKKYINDNGLSEMVTYVGWVSASQKEKLLAESDIYILPSYNEGLPISILEALSYGMPIISTTIGGIPEVVKNGENGFLFEPGNKKAMAESIRQFIDDPEMIEKYGNRSLEIVKPFYPESVEEQLMNCYQKMLS